MKPLKLHATAVVLGDRAVLIRGEAGSGKTSLGLALIAAAPPVFARLLGDDRVVARPAGGRLVLRPDPAIAGFVERRGLGLTPEPHEPAAIAALVVDLEAGPVARLPEAEAMVVEIAGISLPRLSLEAHKVAPGTVLAALRLFAGP